MSQAREEKHTRYLRKRGDSASEAMSVRLFCGLVGEKMPRLWPVAERGLTRRRNWPVLPDRLPCLLTVTAELGVSGTLWLPLSDCTEREREREKGRQHLIR